MNVGFYGHSNCAYRSEGSFIDIIAEKLSANVVNIGVRQGSEERILFELKKTKQLDLAIIFHSESQFIFIPNADRDISVKQMDSAKIDYLFTQDKPFHMAHHQKFLEIFGTPEKLKEASHYLKTCFYHPDLQLNRFYGSLIQIDQYLLSKSIPAIHIPIPNTIPNWFEFKSGVVDTELMNIIRQYPINKQWFANIMSEEGNRVVADHLLKTIVRIMEDNSPDTSYCSSMAEHRSHMAEVVGSTPISSTIG